MPAIFRRVFHQGFLSNLALRSRLKTFFSQPRYSKFYLQFFGIVLLTAGFVVGVYFGLYHYLLPKIQALTESTKSMPTDVAFNASGYSDNGGLVSVLSSEVRIATSSAWLDGAYLYKKTITLKNFSGQDLTASASAQVVVNTKELYDEGKLQSDCDDLRVAFVATESSNLRQELPRSITVASGASDCSDSEATIVTFPRKEPLWSGGEDSNYELYYGNPNATDPGYGDDGFNIYREDGSTVSATLVCPFNGTTTCVDGETPTTETGAIRYSGGKSALSFDGKDDYVSTPITTHLGERTYEAWVKIKQGGGDLMHSVGFFNFEIYVSSTLVKLKVRNGSTAPSYTVSTSDLDDGSWHHVAVVHEWGNASSTKIFIDGILKSGSWSGDGSLSPDSPKTLAIAYGGWGGYLNAAIDEVRISTTLRYTANFTPQTIPFEPDEHTVLLYHFDENGDDPRNSGKAIDASGNGNHGTINGAKYVSGLVGVDSSSDDTGYISSQPYAGHQGIFIEEGTTNLITNPSFENATAWNTNWSLPYFNYDSSSDTFTAAMAKRNSAGPFAAGVMVGGELEDDETTGDLISASRGTQIRGSFYTMADAYQGSIVFWITPEWDGDDGKSHTLYTFHGYNYRAIWKDSSGQLRLDFGWGDDVAVDISSWNAGETHLVVGRWDMDNPIDGTNYMCLLVDSVDTCQQSIPITHYGVGEIHVGNYYSDKLANALIEGLTVYRRPLFDGEYGIDVGNGDEIEQIYNNGSGKDPTLVTGSWDVVFALPTNASAGELSSGTGNAWSHPHSSNILYTDTTNTGGFMMNGTYTNDGWEESSNHSGLDFDGSDDRVQVADSDSLDFDGSFTLEVWLKEGISSASDLATILSLNIRVILIMVVLLKMSGVMVPISI